ncbi:MAG: hypothetical protein ABSH51_30635 [Solirubrobacteraceae bacterium]
MTDGWRARRCPTCRALPGGPSRTPSGREASNIHEARLRPGRGELVVGTAVWEELDRRGITLALVAFTGRAGRVWERYGAFAGQPAITGRVSWRVARRDIVIAGRCADVRFEESVA